MPQVFPEGGGFVLLDPDRLGAAVPDATGRDLLELCQSTELGDVLARTGVMVPVLGVEPGYYDLVVRDDDEHDEGTPPDVRAAGWVLQTDGRLLADPLAALQDWDPDDDRHERLEVPAGTYAVEVHGRLPRPEHGAGLDGTYTWVLRRTAALPWFTADVG